MIAYKVTYYQQSKRPPFTPIFQAGKYLNNVLVTPLTFGSSEHCDEYIKEIIKGEKTYVIINTIVK
jgi:hypothetical protein